MIYIITDAHGNAYYGRGGSRESFTYKPNGSHHFTENLDQSLKFFVKSLAQETVEDIIEDAKYHSTVFQTPDTTPYPLSIVELKYELGETIESFIS